MHVGTETTAVTTAFIKYVIDLGVHRNNQAKTDKIEC